MAETYAYQLGFTFDESVFNQIIFSSIIDEEAISLVAMCGNTAAGWIQGNRTGLPIRELVMVIETIYVRPEYRKHNAGKILIDNFINKAITFGTQTIVANSFNDADIRGFETLFRRSGFVKRGTSWVNFLRSEEN